ncbi:hypothetical protein OH76DRAFT_1487799 [Lentinus brumalis]|uniref:Uncharacterized protein n=1 Tax=Lentinus brumalis TaxID=2498619 RepID=A0A371CTB1_9APHY|nr:hypothetical protein OH76DRAFT_1487799 [Polyporus brumalis]
MSQYSLSTCNPLAAKRDDRRNVVRRVPKLASEGSVLFEAGTLSTRAGTLGDSPIFESAEEEEHTDTSSSSSSADSSYPATPTSDHHRSRSILGGIVVESPAPSRRGSVDEDAVETSALIRKTELSSPPDTPTTPTGGLRPKRKVLPALLPSTGAAVEDGSFDTPAPTPTTPSAFSRAFGVFAKAFNR